MQIARIYTLNKLAVGERVFLDQQPSQHLLRVLRARVGDLVILFNGDGGEFHGKLADAKKNQATVELLQFEDVNRESPLAIHLVQGISRGERMDYVIQKATELGIASITPLFTERCTVKLDDKRLAKRLAHWRQMAISACEQSGRCTLPEITSAASLTAYVGVLQGRGFICDTASAHSIHQYPSLEKSVTLLIGPEGGFADHEIESAKQKGFQSLSLGPRILRTETAPVVAISLLQSHGGDL